ncbi:MYND-type zinc finger-containing chromatin reader Zmynd8 [Musca vetustissima]|uniref:MYND-type zinc finger-containing chromatin reader Zmynd8 n=1 Tax=Musca vetustissima TaxID=27455 RepID=UPI002AB7DE05|nr:MYND-type zinc finger-containing chromatin reader Zmynd8 [Musca vetustissima]
MDRDTITSSNNGTLPTSVPYVDSSSHIDDMSESGNNTADSTNNYNKEFADSHNNTAIITQNSEKLSLNVSSYSWAAPRIVQDDSGLIKKIKISTAKKLAQSFAQNSQHSPPTITNATATTTASSSSSSNTSKLENSCDDKLPVSPTQQQQQNQQHQPRSSTPLSREYVALQQTQNDSKIIKKFVTDAMMERTRKAKAKNLNNSNSSSTATNNNTTNNISTTTTTSNDHSYTSHSNQNSSNEKLHGEESNRIKRRLISLKGADDESPPSTNWRRRWRSRSKSFYNSDNSNCSTTFDLGNKWPSEENLQTSEQQDQQPHQQKQQLHHQASKRSNMRSENSEFVQKQKEFLQHIINSTQDTPPKTRSRSTGPETTSATSSTTTTPTSAKDKKLRDISSSHRRRSRSKSREKLTKRMRPDDDAKMSMDYTENTNDHPCGGGGDADDSSSLNDSGGDLSKSMVFAENIEHLKKVWQPPPKPGSDSFCWKCHDADVDIYCSKCIRSFHTTCVKAKMDSSWMCTECSSIENILNSTKKSRRNELSVDLLSQLLTFALKRMRFAKGNYTFVMPYEKTNIYKKYIINPVHFGTLQEKINSKEYRCAEELVNDTKWMLHNAYIITAGNNNKLVLCAKNILKICRQEAIEIETCAECYQNANTRTDWFVDVCSQPHILLWAKLKGFPYWPAKAMGIGQTSLVNVRFFGEHDRAFVSAKDCFLYSEQDPNTQTGKKAARELAGCMKEVEEHIENIKNKVGGFNYAPFKTPFDPADEMRQLEEMMPGVQDFIRQQHQAVIKPPLQFKIYKTADNNMSIVQKASSTPDLLIAQQQQNEIEENHNNSKKRKLCSITSQEEEKQTNDKQPSAKYEVISKSSSDDSSHPSKLGTVILKRKSDNLNDGGGTKKNYGDKDFDAADDDNEDQDHTELCLPKLQRIEAVSFDEATAKRKAEIDKNKCIRNIGNGKPAAAAEQQKIPVLTIKTSTITSKCDQTMEKEMQTTPSDDVEKDNNTTKGLPGTATPPANDLGTESVSKENISTSSTPAPSAATISAQKVVENLVKNKQGVTIKKISNKDTTPVAMPESLNNVEAQKQPEGLVTPTNVVATTTKVVAEKPTETLISKTKPNANEKQKQDQQVNIILKGLVPFVEIKQEVTSDNEEESQSPEKPKEATPSMATHKETPTTIAANASTLPGVRSMSKETLSSQSNSPQKETTNGNTTVPVLLARVKEEVFSDEEEERAAKSSNPTTGTTTPAITTNTKNEIRVVGDTTIQKISLRNLPANPSNNKRNVLKGVPYGPLPASAFSQPPNTDGSHNEPQTKNNTEKSKELLDSPTNNLEVCNTRPMSSNTMVTIPVDIASTTRSIMSPIPVPPLTAVSKTVSHSSQTLSSMARHNPVTVTVSGTAGSLPTPLVLVSAASSTISTPATTTTSSNSPPLTIGNNTTRMLVSVANAVTTTTTTANTTPATSSAAITTNPINPLRLTTPPPLAGLSGVNFNNNIHHDGSGGPPPLETTTIVSGTPIQSTDTQIPPLRITSTADGPIRALPKLTARPKGILQTAENRPILPTQAGPVHTRLFENAFKVTYEFMNAIEDTIRDLTQHDDTSLPAKLSLATIELEKSKMAQDELRKQLEEMRKNMENEKNRAIAEARKQCQLEMKQREMEWSQRELEWKRVVEETKRKQWCAQCGREAKFYCCWNTSYCDYPCQDMHWSRHEANCAQIRPKIQETNLTNITTNNLVVNSNLQMQMQRDHNTNSTSTSHISPANVNTKTPGSSPSVLMKKDKSALGKKSSANSLMSTTTQMSVQSASSSSSSLQRNANNSNNSADLLKLPTNTYLRPVVTAVNQPTVRCNTTYSIPVQRFNATQAITTPANSSNCPTNTYTILQQGTRWVPVVGTTNPTIAAPIAKIQIGQNSSSATGGGGGRGGKTTSNRQIRYH